MDLALKAPSQGQYINERQTAIPLPFCPAARAFPLAGQPSCSGGPGLLPA